MAEKKVVVKQEETKVPVFLSNEEIKKRLAEIKKAKEEQS